MKAGTPRQCTLVRLNCLILVGVLILMAAVVVIPFHTVQSSSLAANGLSQTGSAVEAPTKARQAYSLAASNSLFGAPRVSTLPLLAPQASPGIATFADDCTTPKTTFNLGETVCAVATGLSGYRIAWVDPDGFIVQKSAITTDSQTGIYNLPGDDTTDIGNLGLFTANNLGTWRVNAITSRNSVRAGALFKVKDTANARVDLSITQTLVSDPPVAGGPVQFSVTITNNGPDDAANVHFLDSNFTNATFSSVTQPSGPAFTCVGDSTADCTIALLPSGSVANFLVSFTAGAAGGNLDNLVTVASTTTELNPEDNSFASATIKVGSTGAPPACVLGCPENISVVANATLNGQAGAYVTFTDTTTAGTCGTVTTSQASGSFFPVGDTVVTSTSSTGDGVCSFTVSVDGPVSISCPSDRTVNAGNDCSAVVDVGTPTTVGENVTVSGSRSDGRPLTDPYPTGTTTITWTATAHSSLPATDNNASGTATCTQKITVNDVTPPVISSSPQTASADENCQAVVPDFSANATVTDNCACASSDNSEGCSQRATLTVIQDPAPGTVVGLGPHTITLTANDGSSNNNGAGNTTTATITFTVVDTTAPTLNATAPAPVSADASCQAAVPAVAYTTSDNCSTVTVTQSPAAGTLVGKGTTQITLTAKDVAGNTTTKSVDFVVNDTTPPVISCPTDITNYLPLHTTDTSMAVNFAATATDNCGVQSITYTIPSASGPVSITSGYVFPVGTTPVTATATDTSGNTASCTFNVTVLYDFTGFFSPISNQPTVNLVKAGSSVPVKFSLSGNKGLNIFAANNPVSIGVNCTTAQTVDVTETSTAGSSSLSYDAASDQYIYVWKTESSWVGTCRQLSVKLNDGSTHVANFKFK